MGWTVFFIVFFGIAAIIPVVWSVVGVIRGNTSFWPCVAGAIFAVALLLVTIIGAAKNWGDCPVENGTTSEGAVRCFAGDEETDCKPDIWKIECRQPNVWIVERNQPVPKECVDPPPRRYCPSGQEEVFDFCERIEFDSSIKQPGPPGLTYRSLLLDYGYCGYFHTLGASALVSSSSSSLVAPIPWSSSARFPSPTASSSSLWDLPASGSTHR